MTMTTKSMYKIITGHALSKVLLDDSSRVGPHVRFGKRSYIRSTGQHVGGFRTHGFKEIPKVGYDELVWCMAWFITG